MAERTLTPNDPVDPETLEKFRSLQEARANLAQEYLDLEQAKLRVLHAAKRVDDQRNRLFESCLVDRGLSPDTMIEIDPRTGAITIRKDANPELVPAER